MVLGRVVLRSSVGLLLWSLTIAAQAAVRSGLPDFSPLVEANGPAVVNISTTQTIKQSPAVEIPDLPEGSPFSDFFRRYFGEGGIPEQFDSKSLGSGFIISADGYIF